MFKKSLSAIAFVTLSASAIAAPAVFSDNFDANSVGLNAVPAGWSVTNGTVDIIGSGYFDFIPGSGKYIDLDGSTGKAGNLSKTFTLDPLPIGQQYVLTFDLAGNHRDNVNRPGFHGGRLV